MNRTIEFRVWSGKYKKLYYTDTVYGGVDYLNPQSILDEKDGLMQYTGLKDKDGTKIFEGDILGYKEGGQTYVIGQCIWEPDVAGFFINRSGNPKEGGVWSFKKTVVIGNIYQNKELIKKE